MKETNSFRGIPYSDYFHVIIEWDVKARPLSNNNNNVSREKPKVSVTVSLDFKFLKSTWLQGTIESNTKAELMEVYELWINFANEFLQHDTEFAAQLTGEEKTHSVLYDDQGSQGRLSPTNGNRSLASSSRESLGSAVSATNKRRMGQRRGAIKDDSGDEDEEEAFLSGDEDDMMFYDCEEGGDQFPVNNDHFNLNSPPRGASSSSLTSHSLYQRIVPPPTPPDLRRLYPSRSLESLSGSSHGGNSKQDHGYHKNSFDETEDDEEEPTEKLAESAEATKLRNTEAARRKRYQNQLREYRHGSTRDMAIQVVETIFVLLEFTFWQIYQFYCYELKDLFDTTPDRVWSRCINAFLPGWHGSILAQPDLYGPLLGVFFLPLTLLWSTHTSRHGCNPTSQLGNAFIVSLLIWIGLSGVYRGLSMIIAPQILYKHCLSIVGYSFVCWNLALLCSLLLEPFKDMLPLVNAYLPLVLLGLPASIAQGLMFWELTPASSMTLEPSTLPQSMQQCAAQNSRLIQRFLWALPKVRRRQKWIVLYHVTPLMYVHCRFWPSSSSQEHITNYFGISPESSFRDVANFAN